ncbi:UDP-N-acetylmuramoyl-tripeptide--D-alanyl-D-alanine ligase [Aerococcus urinaehominis]|uniref:UDP-N-acetylmuramoyl-tripeptide--D-alanyl-D-alanine ligase n=1 Tax=Aerococcus urinaehominis TaxID=128944 RepID=A0A0X8FLC3_9LACT|nr:UDP-N-acetylmuramoyl-tripeptide--D-alanyl-D-alanine ligase [Aerococcus urinaehominis]AMB99199.1 UDP-N-acetylmuramoyl-tripeptide--D-alanyl-D-alanine ligase [Aerococcus urinaehominis]SDM32616.1 UDP-N-acetylmuramoyl-tripeptide--D-alanyl-D-alanine ligase [Aerococcus urinaehominis]
MKELSIEDLVHAVDGEWIQKGPRNQISNVAFNSLDIEADGLFVPLQGQRDGHEFIQSALDQGAAATFWSSDKTPPSGLHVIRVADCLQALQALAAYYLAQINPKVVAITGSSGKTTTKDMTAAVLSVAFKVHKTEGNYNNEIGLPMTILDMAPDTEVLILEMGMSGPGEIQFLSQLAKPHVTIITMIGENHIEFLGSKANIAKAKLEILSGLRPQGTFIYPGDEPLISSQLPDLSDFRTIRVGLADSQDVYALDIQTSPFQTNFATNLSPTCTMQIPLSGSYNVHNALNALATAYSLGLAMEQVQAALANFKLTANRTEWLAGKNDSQILNDTYNASPSAMRAVLQNFSQMESVGNGRKLVVLGDMLELGSHSQSLHAGISQEISYPTIQEVYLYGKEMLALKAALLDQGYPSQSIHHFPKAEKDAMIQALLEDLSSQDQVLVKASNSMGLLDVVAAIKR